jgi:xyloglucan-specific endo-beta-1,4-glucanase
VEVGISYRLCGYEADNDSYSGSNIVADVAYDMFLSSSPGGSHSYEIMVWLAALGGAAPISTSTPIVTPSINGVKWTLHSGPNGNMHVYSFVAPSTMKSFSGDMLQFFKYLESSHGLSSSLYLVDVQAGTEPFSGSNAVLTVSDYSASVA